jgi:signal transduction histidine kinase/FixJ family two-component response regulator
MEPIKIIVLDDEPGITALCDRILTAEGYNVQTFVDPVSALGFMRDNQADLLIVDIRMPGMSGFEVIVEAHMLQSDMAILVMTGYGTVETAIQALHEGVDGLILKPFEKNELVDAAQRALAAKQRQRDSARAQVLRPLFDESEALLAETRPDHLIRFVVDSASRLLQCPYVSYFHAEKNASLELLKSIGESTGVDPKSIQAIVHKTDDSNIPLLVNASGPGEAGIQQKIIASGFGAVLCIPLRRMNFRSVLFAARTGTGTGFSDADFEMSQIFSRQVAIALENALLYKDLRDYIKKIEDSQAALIQAEKLATAGRMTASIAHEINNPLQSVQNCLHLAARQDLPSDVREKYFDMTKSELERLMSTVQRMLDFYRPNAEREKVNLIDILDHVLILLNTQLNKRGIRVTSAWPASIPEVFAVRNQIQQVFINLILNAYDAMPDGGELMINVRKSGDSIVVDFQDSGHGVPFELRDTIFEPFNSTKENGTGLGLSVSYGIVVSHGGNLELLPSSGHGSCFRVTLPASQ